MVPCSGSDMSCWIVHGLQPVPVAMKANVCMQAGRGEADKSLLARAWTRLLWEAQHDSVGLDYILGLPAFKYSSAFIWLCSTNMHDVIW